LVPKEYKGNSAEISGKFAVEIVTVGIRAMVWVQEWKKKRFNKFLTYQDGSHEEGCNDRRRA